ncbi:protein HESO1-like [Olea europaea var. sylvestris]|uniref:protein HESO1-like n=1 Tax=Olea europaea var. sylvestris TaxID=158386 RepID=UPI000C1CDC07|nr:protein HESO1-like [Olea europaea var. sylvestris]XP_022896688.1 protein HESO1-like [Olea europaea var. sylvestris]XP_022896697.1 protein HESO1-like [Olea europaea var. sylvestris]XP_022896704.1 protein HESO1-like [Olea europaea var. sylvestris]
MKTWAKVQNINSSKDKTLNSLFIILLVAFHLQTRKPPILPPFSAIFKDGTDPATVKKSLSNFVNYGKSNKESLAKLFVTLLIKLSSVQNLWPKGLYVSTYEGSWTSKTWNSKVACISVEDFSDPSQNVARAVGQAEIK